MKKLLIVDDLHSIFMEMVEQAGYQCDYCPDITYEECLGLIGDYEGLVVRSKFAIDRRLLDAAGRLRFIGRAGAGMDNIDLSCAEERKLTLLNAPEGNRDAVGEHALGMLLSMLNNLRKGDREIRDGIWDREGNRGIELKGKTVGIIGYGYMGRSFARKLAGLDLHVIAYDKYKTGFSDQLVQEVSMDQMYREADVLSFHIPLTAETRKMANAAYWEAFRKPLFLINTARGEIVDTPDLLKALAAEKIRAAALDVLEVEKFPAMGQQVWFQELISSGRVLLSPHVAGWSIESYRRIAEVLAEKVLGLPA